MSSSPIGQTAHRPINNESTCNMSINSPNDWSTPNRYTAYSRPTDPSYQTTLTPTDLTNANNGEWDNWSDYSKPLFIMVFAKSVRTSNVLKQMAIDAYV